MVLGLGAQGFAAARCFDKEPYVEKIICADADHNALKQVKKLNEVFWQKYQKAPLAQTSRALA